MVDTSGYRLVEGDGATAAIINNGRILLLRRVKIPFISNPGIWCMVAGKRNKGEEYRALIYREIKEETGIAREDLTLIAQVSKVRIIDAVKKDKMWDNEFFIFLSNTDKVRLDYENRAFRWADLAEIQGEREYTNIFANKEEMLSLIKGALYGSLDKK
ncbi:MAG: NUDIX domain-containing protein [Candidatus Micrarchaeota archaeon]|nr:NUDIX domain-containing protein [Candidatus Micrarchaeota archaeon]MDE1848337.1 NUDIX domain-containing protein [Candidatus Micrarchaeota archaeon]MDE1864953.1 NUDIX domain-containing protein [Candidatus Micrarchaeota archaeon]